jgi:Zn-dependent protease with chaperone function
MVAWTAVAAASVVITYLVTLTLGLSFMGFGLLMGAAVFQHFSFLFVLLAAFSLMVGMTVIWSMVPRKETFEPEGVPIDLSLEVRLRAELEAVAHAMGEAMPAEVYLIADANAAVLQRGRGTGFGSRRAMLLGLPILQVLNVSQFRAVLAHEFAHFYSGDTRLSPWVFQARNHMARVVTNLSQESTPISFLTRFGVIALLHMIVVGGLVLYWKLLNRFTQFVSRKQEFRCDELACYLAGSRSLEDGLCNVTCAAAAFPTYWGQIVAPAATIGIRPHLADGFARFLYSPAVAKAVASDLQQHLASNSSSALDTHPPLGARLQKARDLGISAASTDERRAISLLNDLPLLEMRLLQKLAPGIDVAALQSVPWDRVGAEVYVPVWREQTARLQALLGPRTVAELPGAVRELPAISNRIPDPPGTLPTREERLAKAANALGCVVAMAMMDHGWQLHLQPGEFYVERDGEKLETGTAVADLQSGKLTAAAWADYCERQGIGAWPLTSSQTIRAGT